VLIVGVDSLLTVPARCCKPVPPEAIVGFVTRGRGVTIHRANCASLARLDARRRVAAEWGGAEGALFPVEIEIVAAPRAALHREVTEALAREKVPLTASRAVEQGATMRLRCTVEVADLEQLGRTLALLRGLRGVVRAARR
jgi:GTP pyrophosphokinase